MPFKRKKKQCNRNVSKETTRQWLKYEIWKIITFHWNESNTHTHIHHAGCANVRSNISLRVAISFAFAIYRKNAIVRNLQADDTHYETVCDSKETQLLMRYGTQGQFHFRVHENHFNFGWVICLTFNQLQRMKFMVKTRWFVVFLSSRRLLWAISSEFQFLVKMECIFKVRSSYVKVFDKHLLSNLCLVSVGSSISSAK